jgi:hypothetical protein
MAWVIASLPFWVSGFFMFPVATVATYTKRKPGETDEELGYQALLSVICGGVLLALAAWMCS